MLYSKDKIMTSNIKWATEEVVREGAELMRNGEVIVFGSPGVYVLCCDPFNKKSVEKICRLKQRDMSKSFQVGIAPEDVDKYANVNPWQKSIISALLPDTISFIVPNRTFPSFVANVSLNTICVVWMDNWVMQGLYKYFGGPYIGTSANCSGKEPPVTVQQAFNYFGNKVPLYIDSGPTRFGVANTIIDLTTKPIRCIREGRYSLEDIKNMIKAKGIECE